MSAELLVFLLKSAVLGSVLAILLQCRSLWWRGKTGGEIVHLVLTSEDD
jgi:hypothetical protein